MSQNQSRFDKSDGQPRRPGRSNSRGFYGGGNGGGRGGGAGPNSGNRGFKKAGNVQGGPVAVTQVGGGSVQPNGTHGPVQSRGPPPSAPGGGTKPVEPMQRTTRAVPKAPTPTTASQPAASATQQIASSTPQKGDSSKTFNLQFGSLSPGLVNGMQIPARTSSAPPNLHEQKQAQARHDSFRAVPTMPVPSAQKPQLIQTQKDAAGHNKPNTGDFNPLNQAKRDMPVPVSSSTTAVPPKQPVLPVGGMHMQFQQPPQIPMQFGVPGPQIQPHGVPSNSLQMSLPMPMMNASQVPQHMFMPNFQSHPLPQQTLMHQGQSMAFPPQMSHQMPPQIGNIGFGISPQYPQQQQQPGKFGGQQRKPPVRITRPGTNEEVRLDNKRTDTHTDGGVSSQMPVPNVTTQSQPMQSFDNSHPIGFYPPLQSGPYSSPMFFPAPNSQGPMASGPQGPRFSFPIGQGAQNVSFANVIGSKPGPPPTSHTVPDATSSDKLQVSGPGQVSIKTAVAPSIQRTSAPPVIISMPKTSLDGPRLLKPHVDAHQNKDGRLVPETSKENSGKPVEQAAVNLVVETPAPPTQRVQCATSSLTTSSGDAVSIGSETEVTKKVGENDDIHIRQQNQKIVAEPTHSKTIKDSPEVSVPEIPRGSEKLESTVGSDSSAAKHKMPDTLLENETLQSSPLDSSELSNNNSLEGSTVDAQTSFDHKLEKRRSEISDSTSIDEQKSVDSVLSDGKLTDTECLTAEAPSNSVHDVKGKTSEETNAPQVVDAEKWNQIFQTNNAKAGISNRSDVLSALSSDIKETVATNCESSSSHDVALNDTLAEVPSETKRNTKASMDILSGQKDKPTSVPAKAKTNANKKKKKKDILSKADAAGSSDLYNAYKSPEEKQEVADSSESIHSSSTIDTPRADVTDKDVVEAEEDEQDKTDNEDWEDKADRTTPKLRPEMAQEGDLLPGNEAKKRYSRDFLLTFMEQCTSLPDNFEIVDALMSSPVGGAHMHNRDYPSPGRIPDRSPGSSRGDRRDDDKWTRSTSFGPGRGDVRLDMGHGSNVGFRPNQGVNHDPRNPRAQYNHSAGGILSGPGQPMQGGMSRSNSDANRWQRATGGQRGLMPSPQGPAQIMHKAANKYEVGKVSDTEQKKQRQLKAILNKLTPQNFEKLFLQVKEVDIDNTVTLAGVIAQIFDKALTEPTFCEMYANFCVHLSSELPDFNEDNEKITFKRLLLNKCQEEFERGEREEAEANRPEEDGEIKQTDAEREEKRVQARRRMLGNIRLIGELYKKGMLTERIMHECIKKLLGEYENPDEEDVEALCKLMSTIGEMIDHPKAKVHMDAYFEMMLKLSTNQKLSSRVRFMLRDAIDLRRNKWQQRRKVEGPKKIDEVHRDAAQERQAQSSRLARGPVISSAPRRGSAVDYSSRGSSVFPSPNSQQSRGMPGQGRGHAAQNIRMDERHQFESRVLSVPLPQRSPDDFITLGPQGGLARGMSARGQPLISNPPSVEVSPNYGDHRRSASGAYGNNSISREDNWTRDSRIADSATDRSATSTIPGRIHGSSGILTSPSETKHLSEDTLREKSISAIREYYSAKDEAEMTLCIKELKSPSFYPSMVSTWVTDSFERKDLERDLLASLLINLSTSHNILNQSQLIQGFESILATLEDAVNDAPRAAEFLGVIFAKVTLADAVPLLEIAKLIQEGGEEPGSLVETGLASEVLGSVLQFIKSEKGDSVLSEIRSSLRLEDFRPPHSTRANKLDAFF